MTDSAPYKHHLGDGIYLTESPCPGGEVVLTTEDGDRVTNRIVLEGKVRVALMVYLTSGLHEPWRRRERRKVRHR